MTESTDRELSAAIGRLAEDRTDEAAWRVVIGRIGPRVLLSARSWGRLDKQASDDVLQEVCVRLVKYCHFSLFEADPVRFHRYVSRVTRSVMQTTWRRERSAAENEEEFSRTQWQREGGNVLQDESIMNELLSKLLDVLSADELRLVREVATGTSHKRIASALAISPGALAVRLFRIRRKLRKWFDVNGLDR